MRWIFFTAIKTGLLNYGKYIFRTIININFKPTSYPGTLKQSKDFKII